MGQPIWVGCEDHEYVQMGGTGISTNTAHFRTGMGSRMALDANGANHFWESFKEYAETAFWFSGRIISDHSDNGGGSATALVFLDSSLIERVRIVGKGGMDWKVQKVDHLGVATDIGNSFFWPPSLNLPGDKVDIYINYDVAGSMDIYINKIHVFAFIGDITTDSVTELARHRLGGPGVGNFKWSETWLDEDDTRAQSLAGFSPVANGNANTFGSLSTGGASSASNINEVALDAGTLNASSSAGQIDQYTNGAVPSDTLDVKAVVISAYAQRGTSGPSKVALGVRTAATNYWGSDQALDIDWQNIQEVFATNPNTGVPWLKAQIGNASGFNIGGKSAA